MTARSQANILIIDDDRDFCHILERMVQTMGYQSRCVHSLAAAADELAKGNVDLVFLDVRLPDANGLERIPQIKSSPAGPEIIVMTGHHGIKGSEAAIRAGAWDYLEKPFKMATLELSLRRALAYRHQTLPPSHIGILNRDGLLGASPAMAAVLEGMEAASRNQEPVLIHGERGTGKKLAAQIIHDNSLRAGGPLVRVLADQVQEDGRQGPALTTGKDSGREDTGLWAQAEGGTLLLERAEDMSAPVQERLEALMRPGPPRGMAGVRVLATSLLAPETLGREQGLRSWLARAFTGQTILMPPLRKREGDVEELARHFVRGVCARLGLREKALTSNLLKALEAYSWPGNVRELHLAMKAVVAMAEQEDELEWEHLPLGMRLKLTAGLTLAQSAGSDGSWLPSYHGFLASQQTAAAREYLACLLDLAGGEPARMARMAGLEPEELRRLLDEHNLQPKPA